MRAWSEPLRVCWQLSGTSIFPFPGRTKRLRRLDAGMMPPVGVVARYGAFDAAPVTRSVSGLAA
jgi:hypothetical protein